MKIMSFVPVLSVLLAVIMVLPGVLGACADGSDNARSSRSIYYIATNGSDTTGDGSTGTPWATFSKAQSSIQSGDTVLVKDGLYDQSPDFSRAFTSLTTFKAEHQYLARLTSSTGRPISVYGGNNISIEGFEIFGTAGASEYVIHISMPSTHNITLKDNIIHDSYDNDLIKVNDHCSDINISGNLLYNPFPSAAQGNQHMDINTVWDVTVEDNIMLEDYAWSGRTSNNQLSAFIVIKNSGTLKVTERFKVRRNIFMNWDGRPDQPFLLLGEDAKTYWEAEDLMIENNLFLGNSNIPIEAAFGIKCAKNVTFRSNTIAGDMPMGGWAYAYRINLESVNSPLNTDIFFYNNIWSDTTGTMNDFSDGSQAETTNGVLHHNMYWNGGNAIPVDGSVLNYTNDNDSLESNPNLGAQAGLVLPRWNVSKGQFVSGKATVREEFVRLVGLYGTPAVDSKAIDGAEPENSPVDDILGNPRAFQGSAPDYGAVEHVNPVTFDLKVLPVDIVPSKDSPVAGEEVQVNVTVHNLGNGNASNVEVALYDGDTTAGGVLIANATPIPTLHAGGSAVAAFKWNTTGKAGTHWLYAIADPRDKIAELDEANNKASITIDVKPCGALKGILVTPRNATITNDQSQQFKARGFDIFNNTVPIKPVWTVSGGGDINKTGMFLPGWPGDWNVSASQSGISGNATVKVLHGKIVGIEVWPPGVGMTTDDYVEFYAKGVDAHGSYIDISPTWAVTGGGTIDAVGNFTATTPGEWKVYANFSGLSGNASITVLAGAPNHIEIVPATVTLAAGSFQVFKATVLDADNNTIKKAVEWATTGGGFMDTNGNYSARKPGTWTVYANITDLSGRATVIVVPGPLVKIVVAPAEVTLPINGTQKFNATGYDALGNKVPLAPAWIAKGGGHMDQDGLFTAKTPGNWSIRVVQDMIEGTALVTIKAPPPKINESDKDGDGLPDEWEQKWFHNLTYGPKDDPDKDGKTNLQEFKDGTDPTVSDLPPIKHHHDGSGVSSMLLAALVVMVAAIAGITAFFLMRSRRKKDSGPKDSDPTGVPDKP